MSRVVVLVDMDCFYAQVEQRDQPNLWGKPVGVLQYSANGQSGLIAVSYEARPFGVKRGMTAKQCKELCPDIEICLVPQGEYADKADIQKYRDASAEVFAVLGAVDPRIILERASVDEAFLDCTVYVESRLSGEDREETIQRLLDPSCLPTSFIVDGEEEKEEETKEGDDEVDEETRKREKEERSEMKRRKKIEEFIEKCRCDDECLKIALAVEFAERLREKVREKTQFFCSAGVGNNKMMAKLVCAAHKPRKQSFVPPGGEMGVLRKTKINSIRGLGGKLGSALTERLGITTMGELSSLPSSVLSYTFPNQWEWLMRVARGEDDEVVKARTTQTSIGVGKNFPGKLAISNTKDARFWLEGLTKELCKRLIDDKVKNRRLAQNVVLHVTTDVSTSRTVRVGAADDKEERLLEKLWPVMQSLRKGTGETNWHPPIFNISLSASRFLEGLPSKEQSIMGWMERRTKELEEMEGTVEILSGDVAADEKKRIEREEGGEEGEEGEVQPVEEVIGMEDDDDIYIVEEEEEQAGPSTSRPLRRSHVVHIEESAFELDDEGWQVWPTSSVSSEVDEMSRGGTESRCSLDERSRGSEGGRRREEMRRVGGSSGVSKDVLMELPENIRKEVIHMENLRAAKEMKEKRAQKEGTTKQQPKKRKGGKDEKDKEAKKTKPIETFFGGKNNK